MSKPKSSSEREDLLARIKEEDDKAM